MAAVAPLIEYHRRDLLHSRGVVPFERHLVTQTQKPPPLIVADQRALATLFALPWGPATLVVQNVGGALVLESGGVLEEAAPPAKRALPTTPTARPSPVPSPRPSATPSVRPTLTPSRAPTSNPTPRPSFEPSSKPTATPSTAAPSPRPTPAPSPAPSPSPSSMPTSPAVSR